MYQIPAFFRTKKYKLIGRLFITKAAVIGGCAEGEEVESFGEKKENRHRQYLQLPHYPVSQRHQPYYFSH